MTIKELKDQLQKFGDNSNVLVFDMDRQVTFEIYRVDEDNEFGPDVYIDIDFVDDFR